MHTTRFVTEVSRPMVSPPMHHRPPNASSPALIRLSPLRAKRTGIPTHTTRRLGSYLLALAVLASITISAATSAAAVDCTTLARWTKRPKPPPVNQLHVFCGEWKHSVPAGFHARPGGLDPGTITRFTITQPANAQGIYGGSWIYTGHPSSSKFSTMFPDTCSMAQVLNSIVYAATHPSRCPANAPQWTVCGPNRPTSSRQSSNPFCAADDGSIFLIAMAKLSSGRVNTAFPLR